MTDKKRVVLSKIRKLRWVRKKTLCELVLLDFQDIWKAIQKLNKEINNLNGDIKADLSLKELDNDIWNAIISIDGENYVDLKGHLNLVLDNIQLFKRVYDFEKSDKKDSKGE